MQLAIVAHESRGYRDPTENGHFERRRFLEDPDPNGTCRSQHESRTQAELSLAFVRAGCVLHFPCRVACQFRSQTH